MRKILFHILLFYPLSVFGQLASINDTIRINEVFVKSSSFLTGQGGKLELIDSAILKDYSHDNISEVLSENESIFIKSYGSGGIATISLRGTGAGYTGFAWNGVNINSPMLGQTDLSLIPAGLVDEISILYGGTSLLLNSGGIGGIINIETTPKWDCKTYLLSNISVGSFGRYSGLLKVKTGNKSFQSSTKALFQSSENNFTYLNRFITSGSESERRKNSASNQNAFMQELYFRREKNVLSVRTWYQSSDRRIPVPITVQQPYPGETQKDESLRTIVNINGYSKKTNYNSSLSWFYEKLNYDNPLLSINSRNLANTLNFKGGIKTILSENTTICLIISDEISIVNSVNYGTVRSRNMASATASLRRIIGERAVVSTLIRQTMAGKVVLMPDFSTGIDYRLINNKEHFIKINFSHNSKVPTLNDLYWNPGGNRSLKNESSYSSELSYETSSKISIPLSLSSKISLYVISIDDMIKWRPGEFGFWSPANINNTKSSGVEGNVSLLYVKNLLNVRFIAKYAWNKASVIKSADNEFAAGKQLIYSPEHLFNTSLRAAYKNIYLSWVSCYTGRSYTTTDNSDFLKGYLLNNLSTGIKIGSGKSTFDVNLKTDNLFNVNYQAIAWYPMPGRSFTVSIIYQFTR